MRAAVPGQSGPVPALVVVRPAALAPRRRVRRRLAALVVEERAPNGPGRSSSDPSTTLSRTSGTRSFRVAAISAGMSPSVTAVSMRSLAASVRPASEVGPGDAVVLRHLGEATCPLRRAVRSVLVDADDTGGRASGPPWPRRGGGPCGSPAGRRPSSAPTTASACAAVMVPFSTRPSRASRSRPLSSGGAGAATPGGWLRCVLGAGGEAEAQGRRRRSARRQQAGGQERSRQLCACVLRRRGAPDRGSGQCATRTWQNPGKRAAPLSGEAEHPLADDVPQDRCSCRPDRVGGRVADVARDPVPEHGLGAPGPDAQNSATRCSKLGAGRLGGGREAAGRLAQHLAEHEQPADPVARTRGAATSWRTSGSRRVGPAASASR